MQITEVATPAYPGEDPSSQFEAVTVLTQARYEDGQARELNLHSARELSTAYARDSIYERHLYVLSDPAEQNFDAPIAMLSPGHPAKILAYAYIRLAQQHRERSLAYFDIVVHPDSVEKGYEDHLFELVRTVAKKAGAKWLSCRAYVSSQAPSGTREAATLFDRPATLFLRRNGFTLAHTYEDYVWDVSDYEAIRERMRPLIRPGSYRLESWRGITPPELLESLAKFRRQFTMDEQQGAPEAARTEYWTARALAGEDEYNVAVGQPHFTTAVIDSAGEVVGFSAIIFNVDSPRHPVQAGTIVRPEHRGQHLGMTLKAANVLNVIDGQPLVETITTGVDPTNEHLLGINAYLGFVRTGVQGEFRRKI